MSTTAMAIQPVLSEPLVDGDLCDISTGHGYCLQPAAFAAIDADTRLRVMCVEHAAKYFPGAVLVTS